MKRALLITYVVALHLLLAILLFRPGLVDGQRWRLGLPQPEPSTFANMSHAMHKAIDAAAPDGRVVLIGDSHFQLMPPDLLPENTLNFGIGSDTVRHMARRAADLQSPGGAEAVFIWGGYNDLLRRDPETIDQDMERVMEALPDDKAVYLIGLPPVGDQNPHGISNGIIETLNDRYAKRCHAPCRFVSITALLSDETGKLARKYDRGDGIHLNRAGYAEIARLLRMQPESSRN